MRINEVFKAQLRKIFNQQWERRFPMSDYEIDAVKKEVAVRLYGNAINEKYTKLLKENKDLSFEDCLLLDAVQKGRTLHEEDLQQLLSRGLIESNNGLYTISLDIARKTKQVSEYTKLKGLERDKLKIMAQQVVKNAGEDGIKLDAIFRFLKDALPTGKTDDQNKRLVRRLLEEMQTDGMIKSEGRTWHEQL